MMHIAYIYVVSITVTLPVMSLGLTDFDHPCPFLREFDDSLTHPTILDSRSSRVCVESKC
jgi:hypothetical protein